MSAIVLFLLVLGGTTRELQAAEGGRVEVLLADDFEATPVGQPIQAATGNWAGNGGQTLGAVVVADEPAEPPPTESPDVENKQWARLDRAADGRTEGRFDAGDLVSRGGKLHVSFRMYVVRNQVDPSPSSCVVGVGVGSTLGGRASLMAGMLNDNRVRSNDGDKSHVDRDVDFKDATWQRWQIWIDIDEATFEYAVDDAKSGRLKLGTNDDGTAVIRLIEIEPGTALGGSGKDAVVYLDDVRVEYRGGWLHVGSDKQLFFGPWTEDGRDEHLVESMEDVRMTMNPARVTGERLVVQDKPWEGKGILDMRQFVLKDGDLFRMYYAAVPYHFVPEDPSDPAIKKQYGSIWKKPYQRILCYAESDDGIHWRKPDLGLCQWRGSHENNILLPNDDFPYVFSELEGASVFIDPAARSPDEKYKMFAKMKGVSGKVVVGQEGDIPITTDKGLPKAQYSFGSPDGIHWRLLSTKKMNSHHSDTQFSVFRDEELQKYVQYTRVIHGSDGAKDYYRKLYGDAKASRNVVLKVGRAVSDDFLNWGPETVVIEPDATDLANSPEGLVRMDYYGGNVSKYREAPRAYIGLPNAYYHWKFDTTRQWWSGKHIQLPSTLDVQLLTSRDGIKWHKPPGRRPFIGLGPKGTFYSSTIWPDGQAHRVGDELWFYFAGLDVSHKEQPIIKSHGARGRAVLRLDGFISADADYTGGELITRPVLFSGNCLQLNVNTGAGGTCRVELLDAEGSPIEGYTLDDADEINGNYIRVRPSWQGNEDVSPLAGKPVKLRFVMRDTKLYSFQFLQDTSIASAARKHPDVPRILFNTDGGAAAFYRFQPDTIADGLEFLINDLDGTQVDVFMPCFQHGDDDFWFPTRVAQYFGQYHDGKFLEREKHFKQAAENIRALIDEEVNPMVVWTEQAHRRGMQCWPSMRMNDIHKDHADIWPSLLSKWEKENNVRIGADLPDHYKDSRLSYTWAMDYGLKQVRDHKFAVIEEICRDYDVDGFEMDFMRAPYLFRNGQRDRVTPLITGFVRRVRNRLNEIGQVRGRRMALAVRVPPTRAKATMIGLDVSTWIREGLVDVVVPMDAGYLDMNADVADFVSLAEGTGCRIYGGLEMNVIDYIKSGKASAPMLRAAACGFYQEGAAGIYLFNYDAHSPSLPFLPEHKQVLREIGDPQLLAGTDKHYIVTRDMRRQTSEETWPPMHKVGGEMQLPATLTSGDTLQLRFTIGDDLKAARESGALEALTMRIGIKDHEPSREVDVELNGEAAGRPKFEGGLLVFDDPPLQQGRNLLKISQTGETGPSVRVELAEVLVRYKQKP